MSEGVTALPVNTEAPSVIKSESLRDLGQKDMFYLARSLAGSLATAGEAKVKTPLQDAAEAAYLKSQAKVKHGRLDKRGHLSIPVNDPDKLWLAVNVLYPKKEAAKVYQIVRTAQVTTLGGRVPAGWDERRIHQQLVNDPRLLNQLNSEQILMGENACLNLLDQQVTALEAEKAAFGKTRRRLVKGLALGGVGALVGVPVLKNLGSSPASEVAGIEPNVFIPPTAAVPEATLATTPTKPAKPDQSPVVSTPTPESTPKPQETLFNELIKPLIQEALRKRAERAKKDPEYYRRVDKELNENRINFVLFGYGETLEPPAADKVVIGSQTIISYDLKSQSISLMTLTHDIRAPEIERVLASKGQKTTPTKIDQAYPVGGFDLMRQVIEDVTGLAVDFQVSMKDKITKSAVDDAFGNIWVDVPFDFTAMGFYLDGEKYPEKAFKKGQQKMDGATVMQFTKALAKTETYDRRFERSGRKNLVIGSLMSAFKDNVRNPLFLGKLMFWMNKEMSNGDVLYDFDAQSLLLNNLSNIASILSRSILGKGPETGTFPQTEQTIYVVDPMSGDGGVQWVTASQNSIMQEDLKKGVYVDKAMEVPIDANPYARDLVKDYWPSVRSLIKTRLMHKK